MKKKKSFSLFQVTCPSHVGNITLKTKTLWLFLLFPYRTTFWGLITTRQSLHKKRIDISFNIHLSIYPGELSVINDTKQSSGKIEVKKDHNVR